MLLIPLKNYDLKLGAHWLAQFGAVVMKFKNLYMKLYNDEDFCTIKKKLTKIIDVFDQTKTDKVLLKHNISASIHLFSITIEANPSSPTTSISGYQSKLVGSLLVEFRDAFKLTSSLPPKRDFDQATYMARFLFL